jgi:DNA-binding IclR family transcriptional regulator
MSGVIKKSITLLTAIIPDEEKEEWSATEVSRKLDIPIQTVHRLLSSLAEFGFVYKNNETKKFRLGLTLMQLGLSIRDNLLVHKSALPIMEKMMKITKNNVYLTVPEGNEGVLIDYIYADLFLEISKPVGMRTPLCIGASKKVILAHMNSKTKKQIIRNLTRLDQVNDLKKLEVELENIKERGIAISNEETKKGTVSIAAPIFSWEDKVVASISVTGFKTEFFGHQEMFIRETKKAAEAISEKLGWIKPG